MEVHKLNSSVVGTSLVRQGEDARFYNVDLHKTKEDLIALMFFYTDESYLYEYNAMEVYKHWWTKLTLGEHDQK